MKSFPMGAACALASLLAACAHSLSPEDPAKTEQTNLARDWGTAIMNKIYNHWHPPASVPVDFRCTLKIEQNAAGEVTRIERINDCGSLALNQSVEDAIREASPLPRSPAPELFNKTVKVEFYQGTPNSQP